MKYLLGMIFVAGCSGQGQDQDGKKADPALGADTGINPEIATSFAPESEALLSEIYKQKVDALNGGKLRDGRYVSFWRGQQFQFYNKHYFVAFAEASRSSENEFPALQDQVTISQATYQYVDGKWQLRTIQDKVGKFGAYENAPVADRSRKSKAFPNKSRKLFLSVPTFKMTAAGMRLLTEELFLFQENKLQWQYLGQLSVGSDNTANCVSESKAISQGRCVKSVGMLNFIDGKNDEWPVFEVLLQGAAIDATGKLLMRTKLHVIRYAYDEKSSAYVEVKQ
ncbi:MAG: hypothetical protein ABI644_15165 [Arenimonas sp.]